MFHDVEDVLDDIARRAGLGLTDGHPLYTFRVTKQEAADLGRTLKEALLRGGGFGPKKCAAFCMYAAEQFCSSHRGGAWKWETILESVGFRYSTSTLYEIVRTGLRFLGRRVMESRGQRRYLATLACEGGLPLDLLRSEHSRLHRFFRHLLSDRERFPQANAVELCEDLQHDLPKTLRKEEVFGLAARLVDAVAKLREELGDASEVSDPIECLDDRVPAWRDEIPLRLEDAVAAELLRGLLKQERNTLVRGRGGIAFDSLLELTGENTYVLRRSLRFPTTTIGERQLGYGNQELELPNRFRILAKPEGIAPVPIVQAHRLLRGVDAQEDEFRLEPIDAPAITGNLGRISLSIVADEREIARWVPPGGEPKSELPWVFADNEDRMISRGSGAVSLRDESVLFAVSEDVFWKKEADTEIERLGPIADIERTVFRLRGTVEIVTHGDLTRLRTSSNADVVSHYTLRGTRAQLGPHGPKVYSGAPSVCELIDGDLPRQIDTRFVEWRPAGTDEKWRPIVPNAAGAMSIRVVVDEETRFRTKALVVPSGLRLKIKPGPGRTEGCLEFEGAGIASLRVAHNPEYPALSHEVDIGAHKTTLRVASVGDAPLSIGCRIAFTDGGTVEVSLPFPAPRSYFVRGDGLKLRHDQRITLEQCYGTRAEVYCDRPTTFKLAAKIWGSQAFHLATLMRQDTYHSVPLDGLIDQIETLLSGADDVDHEVELMIEEEGFSVPPTRLFVSQYERKFAWDRNEAGHGISNLRLDEEGHDGASFVAEDVSVYAEKLWDIADGRKELSSASDESWEMTSDGREPGNWLISGWIGNAVRVRPSLVPIGTRMVSDDAPTLDPIVHMPLNAAAAAFESMFEEMASDANSTLWNDLRPYAATVGTLPPTTYHIVRHLSRNPDATALAALKFAPEPWFASFWTGLEKLPFLWSLIPIGSWVRAFKSTRSALEESLGQIPGLDTDPLLVLAEQVESAHRVMVSVCRPIGAALEFVSQKLGIELKEPASMLDQARTVAGRKFLRTDIIHGTPGYTNSRVQEVITRHDKIRWPNDNIRAIALELGLEASQMQELWIQDLLDGRQSILDAPVLAAKTAAENFELTTEQIATLQRLRGFDTEWFDAAYEMTITALLGQSL